MLYSLTLALLSLFIVAGCYALRTNAGSNLVANAWYAGWHATAGFPLSKVSWSKYTHLTYAFAETMPDVGSLDLGRSNPNLLTPFVTDTRQNGVKVLVSVGGWTGSRYSSSNVATAHNRTAFVKTVTNFATKYKLDGLDFDWESPASQGIGCNTINPQDTRNFLSFLQELRKDPKGKHLILTAATPITPFANQKGDPSVNMSGFSKVLDFISIMNYDVWGPWSQTVGPNTPLNDTCAVADNQVGSAVSAVQLWNKAGMPMNQMVLGVPSYGHAYRVPRKNAFRAGSTTVLASYPAFNRTGIPPGDSWSDPAGTDVCGAAQPAGGTIDFWSLIEQGYLNIKGTPRKGIAYLFDICSQTPYVYNQTSEVMVSFDSAQSFAAKGEFIRSTGLRGFAMWEAGGDYDNILGVSKHPSIIM